MLSNLRYFWLLSRGFRVRLLSGLILGLLSILCGFAFIYVSKGLVDIATGRLQADLWHYVMILASLLVLRLAISGLRQWVNGSTQQLLTNTLRARLFDTVLNAPWHGREDRLSGDVMNRLSEDLRVVVKSICGDIPAVVLSLFQLIVASWFLFTLQPRLLWIVLLIMPVALVFSKLYYKTMRRLTREIRIQESGISSHIQESIQNRPLLLSLHRTGLMLRRLVERHNQLFCIYCKRVHFSIRTRLFVQAGFSLGYYTSFVWSVFGLMHGSVTYGMMTALLQLVAQVQSPILDLSTLFPSIVQSMTAGERLKELVSTPINHQPTIINHSSSSVNPQSTSFAPQSIRLTHVSFRYPDGQTDVLHDFTYTFQSGTSTAVIGPTGSGKSTLVRLLLGLLQPTDGTLEYEEGNAETIAYVPQGNSLLSGTIRDNLLLGKIDASDAELRDVLTRASALFVYDLPDGLDTICGEKGAGLSEGQAQRIAIARALLQPGSILILDEASSALDPDTERQILEELQSRQLGKTLIWVTHHMAVRDFMQNILLIDLPS